MLVNAATIATYLEPIAMIIDKPLTAGEQEGLEMAGYSWGRGDKSETCYRRASWTPAQAAAFRKGWKAGKDLHRPQS